MYREVEAVHDAVNSEARGIVHPAPCSAYNLYTSGFENAAVKAMSDNA
jgi:hypothetical protein